MTYLDRSPIKHHLEILRDGKGVYGLHLHEGFRHRRFPEVRYILRLDKLGDLGNRSEYAALQMLPPGLGKYLKENDLYKGLAAAFHDRAGISCDDWGDTPWWSSTPEGQTANRRKYHGLKSASRSIVNRCLQELFTEAAHPNALKAARRFCMRDRWGIYRAAAVSRRALQLTETYPALALHVYSNIRYSKNLEEVMRLIEAGALLKRVAAAAGFPMTFQKVKPSVAGWVCVSQIVDGFRDRPDLFHAHLPPTAPAMKRWLSAFRVAGSYGPPFIEWTARNASQLGDTLQDTYQVTRDIADWVRASYAAQIAQIPDYMLRVVASEIHSHGQELITRPFSPNMSLQTVLQLSDEWHEAVAENGVNGEVYDFPTPWCEGGQFAGFDIEPITNSADLYREGRAMHNCLSTYGSHVQHGDRYIYSIFQDGARKATLELVRGKGAAALGQVRGQCNSRAPKGVEQAVKKWFRDRSPIPLPAPPPGRGTMLTDLDAEFPF